MFRRKDESSDLLSEEGSMNYGSASGTESAAKPAESATASSGSAASAPVQNSAYGAPAARPAASEPNKSMGAPSASMYRPGAAPAADMARQARPAATQGSSPVSTPAEKSSGKNSRRILTVGNDILLKGEISTCDRLVIEGMVDAALKNVHTVEIAESGSFKGNAEVEDAEISGLFEGELIVRNRLVIYSSGKVRGKITYGEIEIERGGELTGEIKMGSAAIKAASSKMGEKAA